VMRHDSLDAVNSAENPDTVRPYSSTGAVVADKIPTVRLEPASWNVIRLAPARE